MDPRYENTTIFNRRKEEWNHEKIISYITNIFKSVEILNGWKLIDVSWVTNSQKKRQEELKRYILRTVKVILNDPHNKEFEFIIQVPEIIDDQFFYIGGNLKIPIFQLFDYPMIYKEGTGRNLLKFRNNVMTTSFDPTITNGVHYLTAFGKKIPIELLISCVHTQEEFEEYISSKSNVSDFLTKIKSTCESYWNTLLEDERLTLLGNIFSAPTTDSLKKGKGVAFSFKLAYNIDFFSRKFFKTNSILFEMLETINDGTKSDTDLKRKRIRFAEYILSPLIRKVYDMVLSFNSSRKINFKITQGILIENCNVSDIIHYNFPVNPAMEIASMLQCSLTGPGGFKKDNVPSHLRNLDDSQFGKICPADTPDRDGCGTILNLTPTVELDEDGRFIGNNKEIITSYSIALTPFLSHDDQTRLQMASNQEKQAILLTNAEKPWIKSGVEDCYLDKSTFLSKAKHDGMIALLDSKFMVVLYDNGESEVLKLSYRELQAGTIDHISQCGNEGDRFKKGDILCHSKFIHDGELALGRNLLTGVTTWKGYNYEDGIVVSEEIIDNMFTSVHAVDLSFTIEPGQVLLSLFDDKYCPFPHEGSILKKGEVYAKVKTLKDEDGFESINIEPAEMVSPIDCEITSIEIYPNVWNTKVMEFNKFINEMSSMQTDRFNRLESVLSMYMNKVDLDTFITLHGLSKLDCQSRKGKYTFKQRKVNGVFIKIQAVYKEKIGIGDKIANRHGNKGVISKIIPKDQMPMLPDGRRLHVIINQLGIISRMNVGQLFELHLNEALNGLRNNLKLLKTSEEKESYLQGFLDIIDKDDSKWVTNKILDVYMKDLKDNNNNAENNICLYIPPFTCFHPKTLESALNYTKSKYKYPVYDPVEDITLDNPISCGYIYFLKLVHRANDKLSARSIGPYAKKTLQPLGGKSRQGGHRLGEMEVWALQSHGADIFLKDLLTIQSDAPGKKNKLLADIIQNPELASTDHSDDRPQSLRLLEASLMAMGFKIKRFI